MKFILLVSCLIILLSNCSSKNKPMNGKMKIEFQHFEGCPNGPSLENNIYLAIQDYKDDIEFINIIVDTPELAKKHKFLGSPTLLINGQDFDGLEFPEEPNLTCRIYSNGVPSVETIKNKIKDILNNNK